MLFFNVSRIKESYIEHRIPQIHPPFQRKLLSDVKKINKSEKLLVPADKSANVNEVEMKTYTDLLESSIQADYKKDKIIQNSK